MPRDTYSLAPPASPCPLKPTWHPTTAPSRLSCVHLESPTGQRPGLGFPSLPHGQQMPTSESVGSMHWTAMVPTPPLDPRPRLNFLRTRQHREGHGTSSPDTFTQQTGALRIASSRGRRRTGHGKTTTHTGGSEPQSTGQTERRQAHVQVTGPTGHEQIGAWRCWASVNPHSVAAQLPGTW